MTEITEPGKEFYRVEWIDEDTLIVEQDGGQFKGSFFNTVQVNITEEKFNVSIFPILKTKDCREDISFPQLLPDGRLGFKYYCSRDSHLDNTLDYMTYDFNTAETDILIPDGTFEEVSSYSWNPTMTEGVGYNGSFASTMNLVFFTLSEEHSVDVGLSRAFDPAWSPDGESIVFYGSSKEGNTVSPSRWSIYLITPDEPESPELLVENLRSVRLINWSPDSQWITFSSGEGKKALLWVYNMETETSHVIYKRRGRFRSPSWSPDGSKIAFIWNDGSTYDAKSQVYVVDFDRTQFEN